MQVLLLSNGKKEVVGSERDFSYVLGKYLGDDARDCFEKFISDRDYIISSLKDEIYDLETEDDLR